MRPRPHRPGSGLLAVTGSAGGVLGAVLVALGPVPRPQPTWGPGLTPATVVRGAVRALPAGARQARVAGLWGSWSAGRWQFTGYLTYRTASGTLAGDLVTLPSLGPLAGGPDFSAARLTTEQADGWPTGALAAVLARLRPVGAREPAALVVETVPGRANAVEFCTGTGTARCVRLDAAGRVVARFRAPMTVDPGGLVYPGG